MARDPRWSFIPLIVIRSLQLLFAVVILGFNAFVISELTGYIGDLKSFSALGLVSALLTIIYIGVIFGLYFNNLLLPLVVVIVDAFLLVFYLISMAGTASTDLLAWDCTNTYNSYDLYFYYTTSYSFTYCRVAKGAFALELLSMLLFIASTVFASITLHRNRKDLRGKKHAAGLGVEGSSEGVVGDVPEEPKYDPNIQQTQTQPQEGYYPQQAPTPVYSPPPVAQQGYVQGPTAQFVSPPTSPPPPQQQEQLQQQQTGYSTVSSSAAYEMPGTGYQASQMQPQQPQPQPQNDGYQAPPPQQQQHEMYGGVAATGPGTGELQGHQ